MSKTKSGAWQRKLTRWFLFAVLMVMLGLFLSQYFGIALVRTAQAEEVLVPEEAVEVILDAEAASAEESDEADEPGRFKKAWAYYWKGDNEEIAAEASEEYAKQLAELNERMAALEADEAQTATALADAERLRADLSLQKEDFMSWRNEVYNACISAVREGSNIVHSD